MFCGGLGTTGTMIGNSRYLKEANEAIQVVGVKRALPTTICRAPAPSCCYALSVLIGASFRCPAGGHHREFLPLQHGTVTQRHLRGPQLGVSLVGLLAYLEQ